MDPQTAISVSHLGKTYRLYRKPSDRLKEAIHPFRRRYSTEFNAVSDITFTVRKGDTVGIIGLNGSGKSTLLQLICGILTPTHGSVVVNGRIASLLELGAGFNPNLSGRENIYLYATLIGLSNKEIAEKFSAIVEFAEIGDFLEQPVKSYSSGMYVRLAFSIAINVRPDILVVDEALAVGDMLFQAKCMAYLQNLMKAGVTVLFVSHDINAIRILCKTCIYLESGLLKASGETREVVAAYMQTVNSQASARLISMQKPPVAEGGNLPSRAAQPRAILVSKVEERPFASGSSRYGNGGARILDAKLLNSSGTICDTLELHDSFTVQVSVKFHREIHNYVIGFAVHDVRGLPIAGMLTSSVQNFSPPDAQAGDVHVFEIASTNVFTQGVYTIELAVEVPVILNEQHVQEDVIERAIVFKSVFPADRAKWFPTRVWVPTDFSLIKPG